MAELTVAVVLALAGAAATADATVITERGGSMLIRDRRGVDLEELLQLRRVWGLCRG